VRDDVPVQLIDVLELCAWPWGLGFRAGYLFAVQRARGIYRHLYYRWETPAAAQASPLVRFAHHFAAPLAACMQAARPAMTISTHFLASSLVDHLRRRSVWQGPLWEVITDFRPHGFQVLAGVERYLIPSPEAAGPMTEFGVSPEALSVTGVPCSESFRQDRGSRIPAARSGSSPCRILLSGHGVTSSQLLPWVRDLAVSRDVRLSVFGVVSSRLRGRLRRLAAGAAHPVEIYGPVDFLPSLMAGSDLLVGKAGGLTCSEAMLSGLPMALCLCYPGQEEENRDYLVAHGAAEAVQSPRQVLELAASPERLEALAHAGRGVVRAGAASRVATLVLDRLDIGGGSGVSETQRTWAVPAGG
jgi:processive 1,2-diacylglycerol beta-glucosyltransferase